MATAKANSLKLVPVRSRTKQKLSDVPEGKVQIYDLEDELFKPIEVLIKEKRDRIADEILRSEQTYVRSLNLLYQKFKKPLQENMLNNQLDITEAQFQTLFANLEDLINVNTELLGRLIERLSNWSDKQKLGDVLLTLAPFLLLYTQYSLNFGRAADVLRDLNNDKKIKMFLLEKSSDPICNGLDFSSYLIMPIQRIPRYRLLLEEFIQNTPRDHEDYAKLEEALFKLKNVAQDVDKAIVEQENRERMLKICKKFIDYKELELLQPGRTFVHEGELTKVCRKERKKRYFFLFSDCLVYAHPPTPVNKFRVEYEFKLVNIKLKDIPDSQSRKMMNAFQLQSDKKSFIVLAETPEEKLAWMSLLAQTQEHLKQKTATFVNKETGHMVKKDQNEVASTAPVWVPDSEQKTCSKCEVKFTFTNRRHHCRQCGNLVCQPCSSQKKNIQGQGKVRVCVNCFPKLIDSTFDCHMSENIISSESDDSGGDLLDVIYELEARYDFEPENTEQKLQFKKGDKISILQVDDSGWWLGELNGNRGWVPASFLERPIQ